MIALIIPNNLWVSPYVSIYTRLLDEIGVEYETISWNRDGRKESGIQFHYCGNSRNRIAVLWSYMKYAIYLKKVIKRNMYERLIVFTPQVAIFLSFFLKKYYKGHYIFDYRDLSIEQNPVFAKILNIVLSNSYANVISSPGFKKYLPPNFNYVISHNINVDIVRDALTKKSQQFNEGETNILTIGALRKDMNFEVMDALGNVPGYSLSFVGKGVSSDMLVNYAKEKGYNNIVFSGFYKKEDEPSIIKNHTFINIVYPLIPSHISALSNRFYNSLIYKRPMIVSKDTVQGEFALQYGVGLVIDNCDDLKDKIAEYRRNLDYESYSKRCDALLKVFLRENMISEDTVRSFVNG